MIEIFVMDEFDDILLDEWGDEEDEIISFNFSLFDIQKQFPLINCFLSAVPIIRKFHDWLLVTKHPDPPFDTEVFRRDNNLF